MITILQIRIKLVGFYLYLQIYGLKTLFVNMILKNVKTENRPILYFPFRVKKCGFFRLYQDMFLCQHTFSLSLLFSSHSFFITIYTKGDL